jgi:hypothetical protein
MKILIVAQARSGSSSLQQCIASASGFPLLREPFATWKKGQEDQDLLTIKNNKNIVVKVVSNDFYQDNRFKNENDFFVMFDKVVGLTRNSTYQNVSSFLIASHFDSWHESSKNKVLSIEEYQEIMEDSFDYWYKEMEEYKNKIKSFDIEQFTYEELYVDKTGWERLEDYLGIKLDPTIRFS